MLQSIKSYFESKLSQPQQEGSDFHRIDLASAALLIEVMNADQQLDQRETDAFMGVVKQTLGLSDKEVEELSELANSRVRKATSLYEFTRLVNEHYDYQQKVQLIENMWRIAFSDTELDKYEEYLIRKISELIYVSHSDFIRVKLKARDS